MSRLYSTARLHQIVLVLLDLPKPSTPDDLERALPFDTDPEELGIAVDWACSLMVRLKGRLN
jgi:hypothetical protein